jgi:uncharacterized integral membrane protein (TIGR00698 family)
MAREIPGLALCTFLAAAAFGLGLMPFVKDTLHIGALLIVIVLGMAISTAFRIPERFDSGIAMAQRPILRWAVAGLGFKLSFAQLSQVGPVALGIVALTTAASIGIGLWLGRFFKLDDKLGKLLAAGTSICGASAIVATDSVVQSQKSQVAASLGLITLLGTVGIVIYPPLGRMLDLSAETYSIWNGASLHEMAQVVAAGQTYLPGAQELSTAVKLARITLLAPAVLLFAWLARRSGHESEAKAPILPWFLVAFLVIVVVQNLIPLPPDALQAIQTADLFLLCIGMAGVGLKSGLQDVRKEGMAAFWAALLQWVALAVISLAAAMAVRPIVEGR